MTELRLVYLDLKELRTVKDGWRSGNPRIREAVAGLTAEADRLLTLAPTSVMDKTGVAASNDPHDFYAIGGYSWPNPLTSDGLPYEYRDSQTNPEALNSDEFDKGRYEEMTRRVAVLALAYFYSDDTRYAAHSAALLRTWFIDSTTRMSPHFRYAAARPGVWEGHFSGTIEGVFLIEMLDFVTLLEGSAAWTDSDDSELRSWFRDLSDWLAHSRFGRREIFSTNNHVSYLLAQIITFATYGGHSGRARGAIPLARRQLRRQIRPDGSMPLEIARADGWFYSVYGLRAFTVLAQLVARYDEDLWKGQGAVLAQACASLAPYLTGAVEWPFSRGYKPWERDAVQLYHMAARAYGSSYLLTTATRIAQNSAEFSPPIALLGLQDTAASAEGFAMPAARLWSPSLDSRRGPTSVLEGVASRVSGVLAARGMWPGRRLL
jgi:hypothetical protein